ncbi:hypothetical protein BCR42DRAFT_426148 [Absidia repens]|uniref:Uncharacterized protein n=1 Tax=Absidia repens TaxID=90262 RepID=A0A1X2I1F6_9FUNG|nr:hypothetical protein BCR42DRAFT_426148 [Absidia repens]
MCIVSSPISFATPTTLRKTKIWNLSSQKLKWHAMTFNSTKPVGILVLYLSLTSTQVLWSQMLKGNQAICVHCIFTLIMIVGPFLIYIKKVAQ